MSDQTEATARTPDQFVKRAPTVSSSTMVGTAGSSLGLVALYINECLEAGRLVVPSTEMIIVLLGLIIPAVHLFYRVAGAKLNKWAASQGVSAVLIALLLAACASDGGFASKDEPLDRYVTLEKTCAAISTADVAFQAFIAAKPGVVDQNGINVEKSIMQTVNAVCTKPYPADVDGAMKIAVTALVEISSVIAKWQS